MNSETRWRLRDILAEDAGPFAQEAQQSGVHFFRMSPSDSVRSIFHDQLARSFDELRRGQSCSCDGKDAVGIALNHQRGHVDTSQVLAEVFMPGWDAREAGGSGAMFQLAWTTCALTRLPRNTSVL